MQYIPPICVYCKHYDREADSGHSCKAFYNGIPYTILQSDADHRRPIEGDNGVVFAPTKEGEEYAAWVFGQ